MLAWSPGQPFQRRAFANVFDRNANKLYEAIVDLRTNSSSPGRRSPAPSLPSSDRMDATPTRRPRVRAVEEGDARPRARPEGRVRRHLGARRLLLPAPAGTRILNAIAFYRGPLPNPYDRPIEGVVVTIDMNRAKVVDFVDTGIRPVDTTTSGSSSTQRTDLKQLVVHSPTGPASSSRTAATSSGRAGISGSTGRRAKGWSCTRSATPRTAPCGRSSTACRCREIYVPYAIPDPNWAWRSAFDIGEYNLGQYAEALDKNVDVPENAVFFDEVAPSDTGSAGGSLTSRMRPRCTSGTAARSGIGSTRRRSSGTRGSVASWSSPPPAIGNYTYGSSTSSSMDGSIYVNVQATGTTLNQGMSSRRGQSSTGPPSRPNIAAPEPPALLRLPDRLRCRRQREPCRRGEHRPGEQRRAATRPDPGHRPRDGTAPATPTPRRPELDRSRARRRRTRSASRPAYELASATRRSRTPARRTRPCSMRRSRSIRSG